MDDFKKLVDQSRFTFHQQILTGGADPHMEKVGLDIGYGSLKVMSRFGLHKIQSLVIPFVKPMQTDSALQSLYMNEDDILYIENPGTAEEEAWAVGQKALDIIDSGESHIEVDEYYNKKWFLNKEFQILFNVGLFLSQLKADSTLNQGVENFKICIGLPVHWVKYHDELCKVLVGRHTFDVMMKDKKIHHIDTEILMENIEVIPQHEGTLNAMLLDFDGNIVDRLDFAHKNILLVDAGTRTVDTHLLLKNNKGKSKTWLDVSMLSVRNDICNFILDKTDNEREILEFQLDKYINGQTPCTIKCGKRLVDFSDVLRKSIEDKIQVLSKRIQMVYDLDDVDTILIAGGTGLCYFDAITKCFDVNEICLAQDLYGKVPFDATFSNVVGYYKLLVRLSREQFENGVPASATEEDASTDPQEAATESQPVNEETVSADEVAAESVPAVEVETSVQEAEEQTVQIQAEESQPEPVVTAVQGEAPSDNMLDASVSVPDAAPVVIHGESPSKKKLIFATP